MTSSVHVSMTWRQCEIVWVKLDIVGSKSLYVCGNYRPHVDDTVGASKLKESVLRIQNRTHSHVWIAGDLNYNRSSHRK